MFLKNLKLSNYRNFSLVDLDLSQTTLLVGKNAQGKSNLLESIYFLSTTKSPKAEKDLQLIKTGEEVCRVEGSVDETSLQIVMQSSTEIGFGKRVFVNGVPRRTLDYLGNLVVILFSPEDINLVVGSPSLRRWHIDLVLAQCDSSYKKAISQYTQVITSRNKVLKRIKEGTAKLNELDYWNQQAIENGGVITQKRKEFFAFINQREKNIGNFSFILNSSEITQDRIRDYLSREVASCASLIGPHRDDFLFRLNGNDLAYFGSRGEQRTAVLDLKLSEIDYIQSQKNIKPILLLDDIFSELDEEHKQYVISATKSQQTILSAVDDESIPEEFLKNVQLLKVTQGSIKPVS